MSSPTFLVIDDQPISHEQVLDYLQTSNQLQSFLLTILIQHVLTQGLRSRGSLDLPSELIEQHLLDFCIEHKLIDARDFQDWLASNKLNYEAFRQQLLWNTALNQLKDQITQPQLQAVFLERKPLLDQVVLSWLSVKTQDAAKSLRQQLEAGTPFQQLVEERFQYARGISALEVSLSRGEMPEGLREAVDSAQLGAVLGPLALEDGWYLFRIEAFLPAELDDDLQAELEAKIFEQWLMEKVNVLTIQLEVN
jgi:parvulin-like peptidyl-prolyl isomerase